MSNTVEKSSKYPLPESEQIDKIEEWLKLFVKPEQVVELRALGVKRYEKEYPHTESGFFDYDHLLEMATMAYHLGLVSKGVYFTINELDPDILARRMNRIARAEDKELASDKDFLRRRFFFVDFDRDKGVKGISATKEEKKAAGQVLKKIQKYLRSVGFPEPIVTDSGNGYHLIYAVDLPVDDDGIIKRILEHLGDKFDENNIKVDRVVFNPARIDKLYGTKVRKGDDVPFRPHRWSRVLTIPETMEVVPLDVLESLAGPKVETKKTTFSSNGKPEKKHTLLMEKYLTDRNVKILKVTDEPNFTKYTIECVFDPTHAGTDCIIQDFSKGGLREGGWHYKCSHDSCRNNNKWTQFKEKKGEPDPVEHFDPPKAKSTIHVIEGFDGKEQVIEGGQINESAEPPEDEEGRPTIVITTQEHQVNDLALAALTTEENLYVRGGCLTRIINDDAEIGPGIHRPVSPRIDTMPAPALRELLSKTIFWVKKGKKDAYIPEHPPCWCVSELMTRANYPDIRKLYGIVQYPVMRPDGTILTKSGYDPLTGFILRSNVTVSVPDNPTWDDAIAARDELLEIVCDFPFEKKVHKAAWLAALLTPLVRPAYHGPAPLFLVDANVRAAGKGLLMHILSLIVRGIDFTIATYTKDDDEMRKKITSLVLAGEPMVLLDNIAGEFGGANLDAALTGTIWSDRLLGTNKDIQAPLCMTWFATGNNVSVGADTPRRTCHIRMESNMERPEDRTGLTYPDLKGYVLKERPRLLSAALTLLRAYQVAGRPEQELPPWGSYEEWSKWVRSVIVWIGLPDPAKTRMLLQERNDETPALMKSLLRIWQQIDTKQEGKTTAEVMSLVYDNKGMPPPEWVPQARDVLDALLSKADARSLGARLKKHRRQIFNDSYIDIARTKDRAARWCVYDASDLTTKRKQR